MDLTYWGNLLGMSGYYKLNPDVAKAKLNDFYNRTFYSLEAYCKSHPELVRRPYYRCSFTTMRRHLGAL